MDKVIVGIHLNLIPKMWSVFLVPYNLINRISTTAANPITVYRFFSRPSIASNPSVCKFYMKTITCYKSFYFFFFDFCPPPPQL